MESVTLVIMNELAEDLLRILTGAFWISALVLFLGSILWVDKHKDEANSGQ